MNSLWPILEEIWHVSELTGLSVGVLLGLAVLVYAFPELRKLAIVVAIAVIAVWIASVRYYALGHADCKAEWEAADRAAQKQADARDAAARADAARLVEQKTKELADENASLNQQLADYAKAPHAICALGDDRARRLRSIAPR